MLFGFSLSVRLHGRNKVNQASLILYCLLVLIKLFFCSQLAVSSHANFVRAPTRPLIVFHLLPDKEKF